MRQVVIIEDEPDIAGLLARRFTSEGFRVATASDGRAGLHAIHLYHPDLVILDLLLPTMNGWEVCRSLKTNLATRDIPVIILSAIGGPEDRISLLELGVDDYIVKPCSVKEVIARARAILRRTTRSVVAKGGRPADGEAGHHPDRGTGGRIEAMYGSSTIPVRRPKKPTSTS
jgi:DNA-binding response OmpR family regulator